MKRIIYRFYFMLVTLTTAAALTSCSADDDEPARIKAEHLGTFIDSRDGEQYGFATYDGLDWMTENCRYDISDAVNSSIYLDADENNFTQNANYSSTRNLARYGRLYTLQGALAACPPGWRLPTDEDWQRLERAMGMSASEAAAEGWRGNIAHSMFTAYEERSDLNLLLGGYYFEHMIPAGTWMFMGTYGYYWTSTADTGKEGEFYYVRKLTYTRNSVCRLSMEPTSYMLSARYVRDAE